MLVVECSLLLWAFTPPPATLKDDFFTYSSSDLALIIQYFTYIATGITSGASHKYVGFLCPLEDYKMYAYLTNSNVKLIIALEDKMIREDLIRNVSKQMRRTQQQP